jgi:WD40 repeat protein
MVSQKSPMKCLGLLALLLAFSSASAAQTPDSTKPRLVAQVGHGHTEALTFSPDGRWLAAAESGGIRLWDVGTRREIRRLTLDDPPVMTAVVFSPDGRILFSGSSRGEVTAWAVGTGAFIKTALQAKETRLASLAISPDGSRLAAGDGSGQVCLWSLPELLRERCMTLEAGRVSSPGMSLRFSSDGTTVGAMQERRLKVWDVRSGKTLSDSGLRSPDGTDWWFLGMSSVDPVAITRRGEIIDLTNGESIGGFGTVREVTSALAFGPDRRHALIAGIEGGITMVDLASGDVRRTEVDCGRCGFRKAIDSAAFSPDGRTAVTASKDDVIRVWDVDTLELTGTYESTLMTPWSITIAPDGRHLLVATRTGAVVWNIEAGREAARLPYPFTEDAPDAAFSASGRHLAVIVDGTATVWETDSWREQRRFEHRGIVKHTFPNWRVVISEDGSRLVTSDRTSANLFRVDTGERLHEFKAPANMRVTEVTLQPDGSGAIVATEFSELTNRRGETHRWSFADGRSQRLSEDRQAVYLVRFTDEGRVAVTGGSDQPVRFRDATTWAELSRHPAGALNLNALHLSRDGSRMLAVGRDGAAIYERNAPKPFRSYPAATWSLADLSADGRCLAARVDAAVQVWNIEDSDSAPSLYSFTDGSWAVADAAGRYDTSDPNQSPGLHWVLGDEVIELGQLKTQFYTRGLLGRSVRGEDLLDVGGGIGALAPRPAVTVKPIAAGATELRVTLTDTGGGLGPVTVLVNGKALPDPVTPPTARSTGPVEITIPLTGAVWLPGVENDVEVVVENAVDRVPARPRGLKVAVARTDAAPPPSFYALIVGTGQFPFAAGQLNLTFPAQDARTMAKAIGIGAARLVGADRVHVTVLASDATDPAGQPTKTNITRAFGDIAKAAGAQDTVLVFLAGHGVTHGSEYFYLTQEATSADLSDAAVRQARAFGSRELEHWLRTEIRALKYVVILDTCAAGAAAQALTGLAAREMVDDAQVRAIAQLKEATGSFVLMGSAADKASYETSRFGHGLLTYALLLAMRGELPLHDGDYLMAADWLTYGVKRVRDLSRDIGMIQEPELSAPASSRNFQVARLHDEDKLAIPLAQPLPQLLRVICMDENDADPDGFEPLTRARLRRLAQSGSGAGLVYLDTVGSELPGAFVPRVRYERVAGGWRATVRILRSNKVEHTEQVTVTGGAEETAAKIGDVIVKAVQAAWAPGVTPDRR